MEIINSGILNSKEFLARIDAKLFVTMMMVLNDLSLLSLLLNDLKEKDGDGKFNSNERRLLEAEEHLLKMHQQGLLLEALIFFVMTFRKMLRLKSNRFNS